jgi:methyl-accepting chemotaxis protein
MKALRNLRIGVRLGLAFAFVLALLMAIVGVGINKLADVDDDLEAVTDQRYPQVLLAFEVRHQVDSIVRNVRAVLLERTPEAAKKTMDSIVAAREKAGEAMEKLEQSLHDPQAVALFATTKEQRAAFVASQTQFLDMMKANNRDGALDVALGRLRADQHAYQASLDKLVGELSAQVKRAGEHAKRTHDEGRNLMIALGVGPLLWRDFWAISPLCPSPRRSTGRFRWRRRSPRATSPHASKSTRPKRPAGCLRR